jgi:hypothetical protein
MAKLIKTNLIFEGRKIKFMGAKQREPLENARLNKCVKQKNTRIYFKERL